MARRMADSVTPANLPAGFDLYGGYDDGLYDNVAAIRARFPGKTVIAFTVFPSDNKGDCLDVEKGDATPGQAPGWVVARRNAGHGGPLVYCSWSALPSVKAAFVSARVPEPGYIVAGYPAPDGDAIPPGTVGHQWIDHGPYDESIVVDYLPGIDPSPVPAPPPVPVPAPTSSPRGDLVLHTITIPTDDHGDGWTETSVPWGTFQAASLGGSDPGADKAYWPGSILVQDRDGNVLITVVGARPLVNVPTFILATS